MTGLATTSRVGLRFRKEANWGVTPTTGNHKSLRLVSESLNFNIGTDSSKEIRSDRQTTDLIQISASAEGGFNFELSYGEYDPIFSSALQADWVEAGTDGESTMTATFTTTALTASAGTPFVNIEDGQWVSISGAVNEANNGIKQVLTKTSSSILTFAASTFTAESGTANLKVSSARLKNGVTQSSFTIEKEFADIVQFISYRGMMPSQMTLDVQSGSFAGGSFTFLGKDSAQAAVTVMPGTKGASLSYPVMNSVNNVSNILENGAALANTFIKSLSLSLDNGLRGQDAIGVLGNVGIGNGNLNLSGSMDIYFADAALYQKFINNTDSSLSFRLSDSAGRGYVFTLPRIKYSNAQIVAGGMNQDVMVSLSWQAIRHPTSGTTIIIDRVGAAVALPI
ncbi:MAG: phage tail tube protein [Methylophilaceae bacterium]